MSGRTYVVILFFWALLTVVTPMLIRMSASAKHNTDLINGKQYAILLFTYSSFTSIHTYRN